MNNSDSDIRKTLIKAGIEAVNPRTKSKTNEKTKILKKAHTESELPINKTSQEIEKFIERNDDNQPKSQKLIDTLLQEIEETLKEENPKKPLFSQTQNSNNKEPEVIKETQSPILSDDGYEKIIGSSQEEEKKEEGFFLDLYFKKIIFPNKKWKSEEQQQDEVEEEEEKKGEEEGSEENQEEEGEKEEKIQNHDENSTFL